MTSGHNRPAFGQFDLFSGAALTPAHNAVPMGQKPLDPTRLSDADLIALLPRARQIDAPVLTQEAVRRALAGAVPALEALCRRFSGFGPDREIVEQTAALHALAALGGNPAAAAVARLIVSGAVRGPGVRVALQASSMLRCRLPADRIASFLRDDDPAVRQAACRCAQGEAMVIAALIDLLADLHPPVAQAAAVALGRLGRPEARTVLVHLLATAPSVEVFDALAAIAGDDDWVRLGQTAVRVPKLTAAVLQVLEDSEEPRAITVAQGVRRRMHVRPND